MLRNDNKAFVEVQRVSIGQNAVNLAMSDRTKDSLCEIMTLAERHCFDCQHELFKEFWGNRTPRRDDNRFRVGDGATGAF